MSSLAYEIALLRSQLQGVAEEMGRHLARCAFSPNIRERRDFSCALFDDQARLLAQAAHIPVHLGSLPDLVKTIADLPQRSGHCWIANSPYHGGTHLPDLTLVQPVFVDRRLAGYVAARAHHADVGGMTAGSMPNSQEIYQEGLILPPSLLLRKNRPTELWKLILANVRTAQEREGDLRAQLAACQLGGRRLAGLWNPETFAPRIHQLLQQGEQQMAQLLLPLGEVQSRAQIELDWGLQRLRLDLHLEVREGRVRLDLSGCDECQAAPINATRAITCAACYYPFFCLAQALHGQVVINQGSLRRLEVVTRPGTLVHASSPFPVCAGNVETSQRICDLVWGALRPLFPQWVPATSASTMNNLTIGNSRSPQAFTYYETCGGGHGGGPLGPGCDGQQVAMTNTLNTPAEILETYYPLRLWHYRLREGSGGSGVHSGGRGVEREIELLQAAQVSFLACWRGMCPSGLAGGRDGAPGKDWLVPPDGPPQPLLAPWSGWVEAGIRLQVGTPGGGGWGPAS